MAFKGFKLRSKKECDAEQAIRDAEYAAMDQFIANLREIGWAFDSPDCYTLPEWDRRFIGSLVRNYTMFSSIPTPKQLEQMHRIQSTYGEALDEYTDGYDEDRIIMENLGDAL